MGAVSISESWELNSRPFHFHVMTLGKLPLLPSGVTGQRAAVTLYWEGNRGWVGITAESNGSLSPGLTVTCGLTDQLRPRTELPTNTTFTCIIANDNNNN